MGEPLLFKGQTSHQVPYGHELFQGTRNLSTFISIVPGKHVMLHTLRTLQTALDTYHLFSITLRAVRRVLGALLLSCSGPVI